MAPADHLTPKVTTGPTSPHMEQVIPRARTFRRLKVLTRREARVVEAVAETIFPSDGSEMPTVQEAQVVEYFDDMLEHLELKEQFLIRSLVALLEVQTLVFNGTRPKLFTRASPEERTKNLLGWETSSIFQRRLVFMAIRTMLLWAYVDSQEAERDMGFVPGTRRTAERQQARVEATRRVLEQALREGPENGTLREDGDTVAMEFRPRHSASADGPSSPKEQA